VRGQTGHHPNATIPINGENMRAKDRKQATADREIVISRVFDAPRELVWNAWTDPKQVVRWWGPNGFTMTVEVMDVRPGGVWKHVMHGPDGTNYPNECVFRDVVSPERIVFSNDGHRENGPSANFVSTWTFENEEVGKTRVTIRMVFETAEDRNRVVREFGAIEGGNQTLGRLAEHLAEEQPAEREVVLVREFDAPRDLMFRLWTEPGHVARWWGPHDFSNPVCEMDVRPGGKYRIVMRAPNGQEFPCEGAYIDVVRPERLVFSNNAVGGDGATVLEGLTTVLFAEKGGKTTLTLRTRAKAVVDFARAYLTGMETGWTQSLEKLSEEVERARVAS
jgi:uncharacterized protein YndB with AHSA1/START domain